MLELAKFKIFCTNNGRYFPEGRNWLLGSVADHNCPLAKFGQVKLAHESGKAVLPRCVAALVARETLQKTVMRPSAPLPSDGCVMKIGERKQPLLPMHD